MLMAIGLAFIVAGVCAAIMIVQRGMNDMKHSYSKENRVNMKGVVAFALAAFLVLSGIGGGIMFGYPEYLVWQQEKEGEAALAKASQDRQIKVQEAEAEKEAAIAQAEANRVLGESVRQYPEAMEQKWVEAIKETDNQIIYLPTECSIPVTEASRVAQKAQKAGK